MPFYLVNSGSTHYFSDSLFVCIYNHLTSSILSVELCLFDNLSNNFISEIISLSIYFSFDESMIQDFYVILLDSFYFLILEYNWLI